MPKPAALKQPKLANSLKKRFSKIPKKILVFIGVFLVSLLLIYLFKSFLVVAVVNGRPIFRFSVIANLEKQYGKEAINTLITQALIREEAGNKGITATADKVAERIKQLEDQVKVQGGDLDQLLAARGQTRKELEDQAAVQILIEGLLKDKISVSDQEMEDYFNQNKDSYPEGKKFEEVKEEIRENLWQEKLFQEFQTWIQDIRANAKIIYFKTY